MHEKRLALAVEKYWRGDGPAWDCSEVERLASTLAVPEHPAPGRSAWYRLENPFVLTCGSRKIEIKSVKIKGHGYVTKTGQVRLPSTESFVRAYIHFGFASDGTLCLKESAPAPFGAIRLDRADQEYENACCLVEHGCPSVAPLILYRIVDPALEFGCDGVPPGPLGVVVTGLPTETPFRSDDIVNGAGTGRAAYRKQLAADLDIPENRWFTVLAKTGYLFGQSLRRFHGSGLYRYSGGPSNYIFHSANGRREALLVDLDSSLPQAALTQEMRYLEMIRDVASALYNMGTTLLSPFGIWPAHPLEIAAARPFLEILSGYFGDPARGFLYAIVSIFEHYFGRAHARVHEGLSYILGQIHQVQRAQAYRPYQLPLRETATLALLIVDAIARRYSLPGDGVRAVPIEAIERSCEAFSPCGFRQFKDASLILNDLGYVAGPQP